MKHLTVYSLNNTDHLVQPDEFDELSLESPALNIMTDFKNHRPHVVEAHLCAVEAADLMKQENINIKLVVDKNNEFIGLVSREDLSEQRILLTQVSQSIGRYEVLVSDLMHARESIRALNYEDVRHARVIDIINTLQRQGQEYCLVVDQHHHHIRGVMSSAEISRRLHRPVLVQHQASVIELLAVR